VAAGYFPVRGPDGAVTAVVGLEAGRSFQAARSELQGALSLGLGLSLLGGLALAVVAARWTAAERQRREAAERAARGEVMAQMAAIAAHEIRNPLGVIRGTVELMRERAGPVLSDRDRSSLEDVLGEVERLRRLTEDFMDLSADRPLTLAPVDLRQVLLEAASSTETLFPAVQVEVGLATTQLVVRGDAGRLRQVFANLLTNAAQAQGQGRLGLVLLEAPQRLRVEIRDTGPGLADEVRARLFDPFVSGKAGGTGLGLTLSRRLVERHGGTLTLESFTGKGTVARVDLPASQVG
jgi:signal transduction histidine kinase